MKIIMLFGLFLSLVANASIRENDIFDMNRSDSKSLLKKYYDKSQILFIGFAYHSNHQHIEQLRELLREVGQDKKLKYVVLERAGDIDQFYQTLSLKPLDETLENFKFVNPKAQKTSICMHEWAYAIDKLLPDVRAINEQRGDSPLLVRTVDSMRSYLDEDWPGKEITIQDGNCSANEIPLKWPTAFGTSINREQIVAQNFYGNIYKELKPDEKVIVLYNRGHLLTSFELCAPYMLSHSLFEARMGFLTWADYFYERAPEAKKVSSLIVIDENYGQARQGITFKFSERQSLRYPDEDWAIELLPFKNILTETGLEMMGSTSDFLSRITESATSQSLPEIAQGLIWNAKAHILYSNIGRSGADYESTKAYCR